MSEEKEENEESSEPTFRKVDKRHSANEQEEEAARAAEPEEEPAEGPEEEGADPAAEEAEKRAESEEQAAEGVSLAELSVYDTLRFVLSLLIQQAWIHLGIQLAPGAQELKEDLPQARVAIDTLEFIVQKLEPELSDSERSELSSAVANLQLNYVNKAK